MPGSNDYVACLALQPGTLWVWAPIGAVGQGTLTCQVAGSPRACHDPALQMYSIVLNARFLGWLWTEAVPIQSLIVSNVTSATPDRCCLGPHTDSQHVTCSVYGNIQTNHKDVPRKMQYVIKCGTSLWLFCYFTACCYLWCN